MEGSFLFIHSPLVGPSSWEPLAAAAELRGFEVALPDLTGIADAAAPRWPHFAATAVAAAQELKSPFVVGHSGAGAILPEIGKQLGDRLGALVFVDAVVPPVEGVHRTPPGMAALLDDKTIDGVLLKWLDWWPPDAVKEVLPRIEDRGAFAADMPRLPRSFYDEEVAVPQSWSSRQCGYLKLSDAYEDEFDEAAARRWPRAELDETHLSIYTEPEAVLSGIESLVAEILRS